MNLQASKGREKEGRDDGEKNSEDKWTAVHRKTYIH